MEVEEEGVCRIAARVLDQQPVDNTVNMNGCVAKNPHQSYHKPKVTTSNHDAETHDDRVGRSHVVCLDHGGGVELDEKEYYRPSYMFNWLKAAGWDIRGA